MAEKTIEKMREDLKKAGYSLAWGACYECSGDYVEISTPDGWAHRYNEIESIEEESLKAHHKRMMNEAIKFAYAHYTREKQHEAMRLLLEEMVSDFAPLPEYQNSVSYWRNKAGRLLESMKE